MTSKDMIFIGVEQVIAHPLTFKHKLAIGDDAFASMRLQKHLGKAWDVLGAAGSAGAAAKSSVVANALFAKGGLLAVFGGASTPLGWVIAASVLGGGAWYALSKVFRAETDKRVEVIPKFINTPLDVLAIRLFELMVPLALKVALESAQTNGEVSSNQQQLIANYMQDEWGYDPVFVKHASAVLEVSLVALETQQLVQQLAYYQKQNPDCNYRAMADEFMGFLHSVARVEGDIQVAQQQLLQQVSDTFDQVERDNLMHKSLDSLRQTAQSITENVGHTASQAANQVANQAGQVGQIVGTVAETAVGLGADVGKKVFNLLQRGRND
ncbi:MAG TPA: hypothetical protein DE179_04945 [Oceanospirillaceae bacterium]|nr:hypothetical protein [Oceanospirillaceae bacterium]